MIYLISTLEFALLIMLPLILFCRHSGWTKRQIILNIVLLYFTWYLTYASLHELSHLFGSWITATKVSDYRLVPPFWMGDFRTAYVNSKFENVVQAFVSTIMPYLRDILFMIIGFWLTPKNKIKNYFLSGSL